MYSAYQNVYDWVCKSASTELKSKKENELNWTLNQEIALFMSMIGHKAVGVNKHFMMLFIHNKFTSSINHEVSSKVLWDHLDTLYDMAALNESEIIPFPNEEVDFELPMECHDLYKSKYGLTPKTSDSAMPKNSEASKLLKNLNVARMKHIIPVSSSKASLSSPVSSKYIKSSNVAKTENKASVSGATPKNKQESLLSVKPTKEKIPSSPFPSSKQDVSDASSGKKTKLDRSSSPSPLRKPAKNENSAPTGLVRKTTRETTPIASRSSKEPTPDSSRKVKTDKDVSNKKSKTPQSSEVSSLSRKSTKSDNGSKKRSDSESSVKRNSESSSSKHSSRSQESDSSSVTGSRKSSPIVKGKSTDSSKKKSSRLEEPSKKITPGPKRRRIT